MVSLKDAQIYLELHLEGAQLYESVSVPLGVVD